MLKDKVIIYGAGMIGRLTLSYLEIQEQKKQILGFAVSNEANEDKYMNYKVYNICSFTHYKDDVTVIIATLPEVQSDIEFQLKQLGFADYVKVDFELYQKMTNVYITYFLSIKKIKGDIDILYFASDNNRTSGAFLCMVDFIYDMNQMGISVLIVLPEYGNGEELLIEKNLDYTYIPSKTWLKPKAGKELTWMDMIEADNDKAIAVIENLIEQYHVKLVHNNTIYTYVGAAAAYQKHIPVVWHIRENIGMQDYVFKDEKTAYELMNQSGKVILVSNYLKSCYGKLKKEKTQIIYDGIDIKEYDCKKNILNKDEISIIMVGALYPLKGQIEMIEAARILKEKNISFKINFIGAGELDYITMLRAAVKNYGLGNHVSFLGRQNHVSLFYEEADIAAVCSKSEAFGRTTVEAQLAGCIVIGADIGATSELIVDGETGFLYQSGDYKDLADKIIYAVQNTELSGQIARKGQEHARASYTKERNAEEILKVYKDILKN